MAKPATYKIVEFGGDVYKCYQFNLDLNLDSLPQIKAVDFVQSKTSAELLYCSTPVGPMRIIPGDWVLLYPVNQTVGWPVPNEALMAHGTFRNEDTDETQPPVGAVE